MRSSPRLLARAVALLVVLAIASLQVWHRSSSPPSASPPRGLPAPSSSTSSGADPGAVNAELRAAARAHASGVEVEAAGRVTRLLPGDTKGPRHQRFLVRIADSLTVLVIHNRDLAPAVPVQPGDSVMLRGEYIWNERGGMIHWTHHDPARRHEAGWIDYRGRRYE
jgi:outer membrane receptor protein involved in Fe transport